MLSKYYVHENSFEYLVAQYARSNRSSCKRCKSNIQISTLRLGICLDDDHFSGKTWYHLHCFILPPRYKSIDPREKVYGLQDLKEKENEIVVQYLKEQIQLLKKGIKLRANNWNGKQAIQKYQTKSLKSNRSQLDTRKSSVQKQIINKLQNVKKVKQSKNKSLKNQKKQLSLTQNISGRNLRSRSQAKIQIQQFKHEKKISKSKQKSKKSLKQEKSKKSLRSQKSRNSLKLQKSKKSLKQEKSKKSLREEKSKKSLREEKSKKSLKLQKSKNSLKQEKSKQKSKKPLRQQKSRKSLRQSQKSKSVSKKQVVVQKKATKKIKKVARPTEMGYTTEQKQYYNECLTKYLGWPIDKLKQLLAINCQRRTGTKMELAERCADGEALGKIPLCMHCGGGRLRFNRQTGIYKCPGYMDDDVFKNCNQMYYLGQVIREKWNKE